MSTKKAEGTEPPQPSPAHLQPTPPSSPGSLDFLPQHSKSRVFSQSLSPIRDQFPDQVEECQRGGGGGEAAGGWEQIGGVAMSGLTLRAPLLLLPLPTAPWAASPPKLSRPSCRSIITAESRPPNIPGKKRSGKNDKKPWRRRVPVWPNPSQSLR